MKINSLNIGPRLGLGFLAMLLLMTMLTIIGINSMRQIQARLNEVVEDNVVKMELVQQMSESVHIVARVVRTLVLLSDENQINAEIAKIAQARSTYDAARDALEKLPASEAGKAIRERMREARLASRPLNDKVIELAKAGKDAEAIEVLLKDAGPAVEKWQRALDENINLQREANKTDEQAAREAYETARLMMFALAAAALAVGALVAWLITRSITRPLNAAMTVAQAVAAGDLTQKIVVDGGDETGRLMQALKEMNESLARIVGEVRGGTETIATASRQIASGNLDLSGRTEEQASSLEETASSMEELTSTVRQNADNATQANQLVQSASSVAIKGGEVVAQVVDTMGAINDSAKKIVDIIAVIDGIAFQTNILALNAAVEAARAGEQGRGFAVVASEVRNLAQRSAAAAKEIKELIGNSVEKVDIGAKLVDQAGATMEEIVSSVKRVTDIMNEITAASREQASGIAQVNDAITQMDQVTQENAALVEEAAAAAQSLQDQSANLAQVVSVFKLDGMHGAYVAPKVSHAVEVKAKAPAPDTRKVIVHPRAVKAVRTAPAVARREGRITGARAEAGGEWEEF